LPLDEFVRTQEARTLESGLPASPLSATSAEEIVQANSQP
jgi:hypothetical protein